MKRLVKSFIGLLILFTMFTAMGTIWVKAEAGVEVEPLPPLKVLYIECAPPSKPAEPNKSWGEFKVTFYDACVSCCGNTNGITKSGAHVEEGLTIAVDPKIIPLGTKVYIEGIGYRTAQDTGGAIKGKRIDVYVSTHSEALKLGVKYAEVRERE